jgi:hypothetical protein
MGLLCVPHHRRLEQGWKLELLADRRVVVHPPRRSGSPAGLARPPTATR